MRQCKDGGTPVFVKQLGAHPMGWTCAAGAECTHPDCGRQELRTRDRRGGDPNEWPEDLRVRQFPDVSSQGPRLRPLTAGAAFPAVQEL